MTAALPDENVHRPPQDRCVTLRDGRRFGVADFGTPSGTPVFYFHGFPASRLEARLIHRAAVDQGIRLVAPDRPGFGLSDFVPSRSLMDWPNDVGEIADALALERYAILGLSGGAPYALACGAHAEPRLRAIAIVAGLGMTHVAEDFARLEAFERMSFHLARAAPALSRALNRVLATILRWRPELLNTMLAAGMSGPDSAVLTDPDVEATLAAALREALRAGSKGASHELALLAQRWDFDPAAVRVPCYLWHGEEDCTVPIAMARRLATLIPGCRATFLPGEGHFSLPLRRADTVLRTLRQHLSGEQAGSAISRTRQ